MSPLRLTSPHRTAAPRPAFTTSVQSLFPRLLVLTLGLGLGLAVVGAGCRERGTQASGGCREDKDCGEPASGFRCEPKTGECYCRTNDGCPRSQFCNTSGFCQDRTGCEKNSDCGDPSLFCDTTNGTCLTLGRCSLDLHCPVGQICDFARTTCVEGCRSHGDCPGVSCRCGDEPCQCTGTTPEELAQCAIGTCDSSFCADQTFCPFGQLCGPRPDAGSDVNQCYSDKSERRPYCANCSFGGGISVCGQGANYCLIDTANPGNYFCGADCSSGEACPHGFSCSDVIVVGEPLLPQCTRSNPSCPVNFALPCTKDEECSRGGVCAKEPGQTSGYCAGRCSIREGDDIGYCGCLVDTDCVQETCSAGECSISRRKCVNEQDCRAIRCVDFQGRGGCLIGQNCAPANGLTCNRINASN